MYDLNQIPYNYTVEVTDRLNGLGLVDRVLEELWTEVHNTGQEAVTKTIPRKKMQEGKVVVWGGIAEERREMKGKDIPSWMQSSKG